MNSRAYLRSTVDMEVALEKEEEGGQMTVFHLAGILG